MTIDIAEIKKIHVSRDETLRYALEQMDRAGKGLLLIVDQQGRFERTVTDGDLRRELLSGRSLDENLTSLSRTRSVTIPELTTRRKALEILNKHSVDHLPVVSSDGHVVSLLERREIDTQILLSTPHMGESEHAFVEEAFRSNWIAPLGPHVDAFESEMAELIGKSHALAVNSGTAAIHLALRLLGVEQGDRVFCSTLTFVASANPITYQGATPVFIDSERESWNMCPIALENAFGAARAEGWKPKAVIVVNLYGQSADYDAIQAVCDAYKVPIVEDAAESLGGTYKGCASGSFGRLSILSFNGNKIITTSGGGMLLSDEPDLIEQARFLATQARDLAPHYQHSTVGYNYRLSNILAGVGRGQLESLHDRVRARRAVFESYRNGLSDISELIWMPEPAWSKSTRWLTTCTIIPNRTMDSEKLRLHLADDLIEARPVWKPMHLQPVFSGSRYYTREGISVSDDLFANGLCLPSGSNLSSQQIGQTIESIRAAFGR